MALTDKQKLLEDDRSKNIKGTLSFTNSDDSKSAAEKPGGFIPPGAYY